MAEHSIASSFSDCNLFAYCGNNPICREDHDGEFWNFVIGAAVGAVVSAAITAIDSYTSTGSVDWISVLISAGVGAASGAIAASGMGALVQAGLTAGACSAGDVLTQVHELNTGRRTSYNPVQTIGAGAMGFATSIVSSAIGNLAGGSTIKKGEALISRGRGNSLLGVINRELGRSHSALIRHGAKMVAEGTVIRNTGRGIVSVMGTLATARMNMLWASMT